MKKILIAVLSLSFLFTGCRTKDNDTDTDLTNNGDNSTNTGDNNNVNDGMASTFTSFEDSLKEAGIEVTNKVDNFTKQIGAKEGYRYESDQGYIEVYYFDNTDTINTIKENKMVTVDNNDYPVLVNGNWVLFTKDLAYDQDVRGIFHKLK